MTNPVKLSELMSELSDQDLAYALRVALANADIRKYRESTSTEASAHIAHIQHPKAREIS